MTRVDLIRSELCGVLMELDELPQPYCGPVYVARARAANALKLYNEEQALKPQLVVDRKTGRWGWETLTRRIRRSSARS